MAFNKTASFQQALLNYIRGIPMPAEPAALYVALCTADPTDAGSVADELPAGGGYARGVLSLDAPVPDGATKHHDANGVAVTIGPFPAGVTVSHVLICTGGVRGVADALYYGPIVDGAGVPTPTVVAPGKVWVSPVGNLLVVEG